MNGSAAVEQSPSFPAHDCGVDLTREPSGVLTLAQQTTLSYPEDGADVLAKVEDISFWFAHRNAVIASLVERYAPSGAIWDIGGGNGYQANMLQKSGVDVVLVEPGPSGCANAVRRGVNNVVRATLGDLKVNAGALAAVSLFDVIEHLPHPETMLAECHRVVRPGGYVFVTVPAYQALWSDEDDYAQHHRRYTRALLEQQLTAAGFRVAYATYFFQALALPILLLRALPYRLSGSKKKAASTDVGEHTPGGLSQKVVDWLLARELAVVRRGGHLGFGSSIVAVGVRD